MPSLSIVQRRHCLCYLERLKEFAERYRTDRHNVASVVAQFEQDWAQLQEGQVWAAVKATDNDTRAALCAAYHGLGKPLIILLRGARVQIQWQEAALRAIRRLQRHDGGGERPQKMGDYVQSMLDRANRVWTELGARSDVSAHLSNLIATWGGGGSVETEFLTDLAKAHAQLGSNQQALDYYEQALARTRKVMDRQGESVLLNGIGLIYHAKGDYEHAYDYFKQALTQARESGDRAQEASCLNSLGLLCRGLKESPRALDYFQHTLRLARELARRDTEGTALNNIGLVCMDLGQNERALECFEDRLAIAREEHDKRAEGAALGNIGLIYSSRGEHDKAASFHIRALSIAREMNYTVRESGSLGNLGKNYMGLRQFDEALSHYQQARSLFESLGATHRVRQTDQDIATVGCVQLVDQATTCEKEGDLAQALALFQKARELAQSSGVQHVVAVVDDCIARLQSSAIQTQLITEAPANLARSSVGAPKTVSSADPGMRHFLRGEFEQAAACYREALVKSRQTGNKESERTSLGGLGMACTELKQFEEAIDCFTQQLALARAASEKGAELEAFANLGAAFFDQGNYQKAEWHYSTALDLAVTLGSTDLMKYLAERRALALDRVMAAILSDPSPQPSQPAPAPKQRTSRWSWPWGKR